MVMTSGEVNLPEKQRGLMILGALQLLVSAGELGVGSILYDEVSSVGIVNVELYIVKGSLRFLGTWWAVVPSFVCGVLAVVGARMNQRAFLTAMVPLALLAFIDAGSGTFIEGFYHLQTFRLYNACATAAGTGKVTVGTSFLVGSPDLYSYGASAGDQQSAVQCMKSYYLGDTKAAAVGNCYCVQAGGGGCIQLVMTSDALNNLKHDCGFYVNTINGSNMSPFTVLLVVSVALAGAAGLLALVMVVLGIMVLMTPPGDGAAVGGDGEVPQEDGCGGTVVDPAETTKNAPTIELMEVVAPLPVASSPFRDVRRGAGAGTKGFEKQQMKWAGGGATDTIPLPESGSNKGKDALKKPLNIWANAPAVGPKDPGEV